MGSDVSIHSEEALNDLGHLASAVGHHVINAFSAIVSNAELLRLASSAHASSPSASPPDPSALIETIVQTALEASGVARRLIDFTRPITTIGSDLVALDRLITDVVAIRKSTGRPGIEWVVKAAPVPPIQGHVNHLRGMLDLLLTNALEALPRQGGTITLATARDQRGWIVLEVRDTGLGMAAGTLKRAVEPFFTTKAGHVGVGLSIANGIWRRHRGTLMLRSQPGEGTQVRLFVEPIASALPPTVPIKPRPVPPAGGAGAP